MAVAFPYTRVRGKSGIILKPYIYGLLRHGGRATPPWNMLVDTGSDFCLFDVVLVQQLLGLDVTSVGRRDEIYGLEGKQPAFIYPADLYVRDLRRAFAIRDAYYTRLSGGIAGILGHNGFLDQVSVRFVRGRHFEVESEMSP